MNWRKSTFSANGGGECVEVANGPGRVLVRDTKQEGRSNRTVVQFSAEAWKKFAAGLK